MSVCPIYSTPIVHDKGSDANILSLHLYYLYIVLRPVFIRSPEPFLMCLNQPNLSFSYSVTKTEMQKQTVSCFHNIWHVSKMFYVQKQNKNKNKWQLNTTTCKLRLMFVYKSMFLKFMHVCTTTPARMIYRQLQCITYTHWCTTSVYTYVCMYVYIFWHYTWVKLTYVHKLNIEHAHLRRRTVRN